MHLWCPPLPLSCSNPPSIVKAAIATLKATRPSTRVLLSVGGSAYTNWAGLSTTCIKALVQDLDLDGFDLDYEPANIACTVANGAVSCNTDAQSVAVTAALRAALPRPTYLMGAATWHIGMYGEGAFAAAKVCGIWVQLKCNVGKREHHPRCGYMCWGATRGQQGLWFLTLAPLHSGLPSSMGPMQFARLMLCNWHMLMHSVHCFALHARPTLPAACVPVQPGPWSMTGVNLAMAKSTGGQAIDFVSIMAYLAGDVTTTGFDWAEAYRAHRAWWRTQVGT